MRSCSVFPDNGLNLLECPAGEQVYADHRLGNSKSQSGSDYIRQLNLVVGFTNMVVNNANQVELEKVHLESQPNA